MQDSAANTPEFRAATAADIPAIVAMLTDDPLGASRENPGDPGYDQAFSAIAADPNQELVVAERDGEVVGTLQLTFTPGLSRVGATRATIEGVRVRADQRGAGVGEELFAWAIERARVRGASLVQLTTDATRKDAQRFYERLGFVASHIGMKLPL
ncbi:GNAT family N-acetyltransferase [Actinokineospora pegani]|uniref:GNAT family N-acetyltransferase n=1 Tax=Actinokineospora pegani TaxID=2654637 RepID=UPI0022A6C8B4